MGQETPQRHLLGVVSPRQDTLQWPGIYPRARSLAGHLYVVVQHISKSFAADRLDGSYRFRTFIQKPGPRLEVPSGRFAKDTSAIRLKEVQP